MTTVERVDTNDLDLSPITLRPRAGVRLRFGAR
jgi:hypothetical protein